MHDTSDIARKFIHRHATLVVSDLDSIRKRLKEDGIELLFDASTIDDKESDPLISNVSEGWIKMYGDRLLLCQDLSGNLFELIQGSPESSRWRANEIELVPQML